MTRLDIARHNLEVMRRELAGARTPGTRKVLATNIAQCEAWITEHEQAA